MKVFLRNTDGTRGPFLGDLDDEATVRHWERQAPLRRIRMLATDRVRAVRLRIACGTFGRGGGAHRECRHRRRDQTRLLYRLISG